MLPFNNKLSIETVIVINVMNCDSSNKLDKYNLSKSKQFVYKVVCNILKCLFKLNINEDKVILRKNRLCSIPISNLSMCASALRHVLNL